ncbi:hypothetical protein B0H12DRAFT_1071816 [Mycena haematopus]|nr:hypothetical protein B0H12DRAFT_1071816 [Mycena haematopus]
MSREAKPLPLSATLRDLALLRASALDVASLVPTEPTLSLKPDPTTVAAVELSWEFVQQARAAIRLYNHDEVERTGESVEAIRTKVEELSEGLDDARITIASSLVNLFFHPFYSAAQVVGKNAAFSTPEGAYSKHIMYRGLLYL